MTIKQIFNLCFFLLIFSCASPKLSKIEGKRIDIDNTLEANASIERFIKPYREHLNKNMDSIISYATETYSKSDGAYNTALGNLLADAIFDEGNPIFNKRTGKNIDLVLFNHGGIRSIISQGNVSIRTAYQVMPFENSTVVVGLKGAQINDMMTYLSKSKRAHPVSRHLQLELNKNGDVNSATIHGLPIDDSKIYYVATNDYLYNGGDGMDFFHPNEGLYVLNYKIRDVLIDNFKKTDTLKPKRDKRFIQLKD
ncbi:5'-nucleotidase C-terminal domain-containing protein [Winogradskyella bathintestinalis]|uniref:5'-nucleotidase n=1 Tax=Winogradskyella bathintestinalis TaxID=3035208 RepID=A0ABT7ZYE5_9FLAO|nr:5'-nucleotidase [Winogradskyella bathintestinalis]MDN3494016.1 5'-nucleotidase [Winogradskyella bathintestinalis]